jgi:histidinol phosphatase-like PHP family hydrolase
MSHRREFLKRSALFGAAAVTLSPISASFGGEPEKPASNSDTYSVTLKALRTSPASARQITIPDVEGFKVLKGDFHIHTLFSDGQVMPKDRVVEAVANGLDVIAITDHIEYRPFFSKAGRWKLNDEQANNFNLWYDVAKPEAEKRNLLLVRGAEITKSTMPPGHFNALFANDNNPIAAAVDDWRTMLKVSIDQGAFLLWNHPGWEAPKSGGIEPGTPLRFTKTHEEICKQGLMHGIEIFNGYDFQYYPIVSDWCNERNLALFANSDIHPSELELYGIQNPLRPMTLVLTKERTVESVKEAFFALRTIGWAANMLWGRDPWLPALFKASVEIKTLTPGTLELTNKSSLPISITIGGSVVNLPKDVKLPVYRAENVKTLTVANWMIGMNKPLEISLEPFVGK